MGTRDIRLRNGCQVSQLIKRWTEIRVREKLASMSLGLVEG